MLGWRLLMSAILVPSVIGLFWLDHRIGDSAGVLLIFAVFVACRNSYELTDLMRVRCMKPSFPVTLLLSVGVVLAGWAHTWIPIDWVAQSALLVSLGFLGGTLGTRVLPVTGVGSGLLSGARAIDGIARL